MSVALPVLMADLQVSASVGQWLTAGFLLTMSVVIPITGFLIRRFRTRSLFGAAMGLFSTGTLLAALAPGFPVLLAARVVQAERHRDHDAAADDHGDDARPAGPPRRDDGQHLDRHLGRARDRARRLRAGAQPAGLAVHVLAGPADRARRRWSSGCAGSRTSGSRRAMRIDVVSVVLSAFGFGGLVYGLSSFGQETAGPSTTTWVAFAVGAVGLAAFVGRQLVLQRDDRALLDLRTFRFRIFTAASLLMMVMMAVLLGAIVLLPDLHADRAGACAADHRPAPAARRPADGSARAGRGPALRPVRRAGAAGARAPSSPASPCGRRRCSACTARPPRSSCSTCC